MIMVVHPSEPCFKQVAELRELDPRVLVQALIDLGVIREIEHQQRVQNLRLAAPSDAAVAKEAVEMHGRKYVGGWMASEATQCFVHSWQGRQDEHVLSTGVYVVDMDKAHHMVLEERKVL